MALKNSSLIGSLRTRHLAFGAGTGAVLCWGIAAALIKGVNLDGLSLAFYRMWLGAAMTLLLLYMRGGRLTYKGVLASVPGGLALACDCTLFFLSVKMTTISNAAVIGSLIPVPILLVGPFMFRERVTLHDLGWVAAALAGVSFVVFGSSGTPNWSPTGDLLAVGSMMGWAAYFIASKWARRNMGALEYLATVMLVSAIAITPAALIFDADLSINSGDVILGIVLLSIVPSLGHLLMQWAHAHLELWVAATLASTMPVVAAVVALVAFGEPIVSWQAVGMLLVVVTVGKIAVRTGQMEIRFPARP